MLRTVQRGVSTEQGFRALQILLGIAAAIIYWWYRNHLKHEIKEIGETSHTRVMAFGAAEQPSQARRRAFCRNWSALFMNCR